MPKKPSNIIELESEITGGPNNTRVKIRHIRPAGSENTVLPAILFIHGGGWVFGSMQTHGSLVYALAQRTPAAVIFVEYSPSPEAQYPTALEECYAALSWMSDNASSLSIDPKRIAVAGDSAGGNLTAALCLLAKERGNKTITYQVLYYPVLGDDFDTPSYIEHKDNNMTARHVMMYVWDAYAPPEVRAKEIKAVPRKATKQDLEGLPPALIITADYDVLKDEAHLYAKQLIKAGVETVPVQYIGVQHGFLTVMDKVQTEAALVQTISCLKKAWNTGKSSL
ncbi:alpha/beta hydrolase fold-domain-containing protein [Fennellomyces sp. T-0311]|nr:alpha/beta hydrolase fold-domain-containing protein [Fennellomyces sp. T-0311]